MGYAYSEVGGPPETRAWRSAGMNLFRSEEHPRRWAQFNPDFETNLQPLAYWLERFRVANGSVRVYARTTSGSGPPMVGHGHSLESEPWA